LFGLDRGIELEIVRQQVLELAEGRIDQQVLAAQTGGQLGDHERQEDSDDTPSPVAKALDLRPGVAAADA